MMGAFSKLCSYLKMALVSLYLNRIRSLLSILGIVIGVLAVTVIISVGEGTKKEALRQIEQLGIRNVYVRAVEVPEEKKRASGKKYHIGFTAADMTRIKKGCSFIEKAAGLKIVNASVVGAFKEISPQIASVTAAYGEVLGIQLKSGRFFSESDNLFLKEVCIIGYDIARALGREGHIGGIVRIEDHQYKIIGIIGNYLRKEGAAAPISARNYNEMIFLPMGNDKWVERNNDFEVDANSQKLTELILRVDSADNVLSSSRIIQRIMENNHPDLQDYQIVTPLELLHQTSKTNTMFSLFLVTIASISLLVGGIGIMNIMLASVLERRVEIGTRRAVGANKRHILMQFLAESFILTLLGGCLGIVLGVGLISLLSFFIPWKFSLTSEAIALPIIISSLTGLLSGIYPAYSAAHVDPIMALRS